jgi:3-hydroxyisobutyrate dehydrogenase
MRIGFAGLGIMGAPMAGHLLAAGHDIRVWNRSRGPGAEALLAKGATWVEGPAALAEGRELVITMLGFPADVEAVWRAMLPAAAPGAALVDMTTSSPRLAAALATEAAARGLLALDAPVSGGDAGARNATLSIMCGGSEEAFTKALPALETMGRNIRRMGGPGAGQHTKMANQIAIASAVLGVAEALAYARSAGLDGAAVIEALAPGAAGSFQLTALGPKMLAGDFAPGFMVKHFLKDLSIALDEAQAMQLELPGLAQARRLFGSVQERLGGEVGTQAIATAVGQG